MSQGTHRDQLLPRAQGRIGSSGQRSRRPLAISADIRRVVAVCFATGRALQLNRCDPSNWPVTSHNAVSVPRGHPGVRFGDYTLFHGLAQQSDASAKLEFRCKPLLLALA